jgi:hypothetical protein
MKQRASVRTAILVAISCILFFSNQSGAAMGDYMKKIVIAGDDFFEWFPAGDYNSLENEFLVSYRISGYLDTAQVGVWLSGINARRIAHDGTVLGDPIENITTPGTGLQAWSKPAYNQFRNEYMISFVLGKEGTGWDLFARILDAQGNPISEIITISAIPAQSQHPFIVFNPIRRVYFITWDDNRNGTNQNDVFGIMLKEDGSIDKEEFVVCDAPGDQIFTDMAVNTDDGSALVTWEDFRNVDQWRSNGDIYGAVVSGIGEIIKKDIPVCDDHGKENEGDQRQQHQTYNSKADNFFVVWWDERPTTQNAAVYARIINANGEPAGDDFLLVDAPKPQIFCSPRYHEKTDRIFAVWDDMRDSDPDSQDEDKRSQRDIYARWFLPTGEPDGPEIPIETNNGEQRNPKLIYNSLTDSFLIAWRDYNVDETGGGGAPIGGGHITEAPGNVVGMVYGTPSFITARAVDKHTRNPVNDASVAIWGIGLKSSLKTNAGGWFNIADEGQRKGWYIAVARKSGFRMAVKLIRYTGKPVDTTIELSSRN